MWAAAGEGKLRVVELLLDKNADPDSRNETWSALGLACYNDNIDTALLLVEKGADLYAIIRDNRDALSFYGEGSDLNDVDHSTHAPLTALIKEERRQQLRTAFVNSPTRRMRLVEARWVRRLPFMMIMCGCDSFQPLSGRRDFLLNRNPPLPTHVSIPPIIFASRHAHLLVLVFGHEGFIRLIASFL
jgi:hypothetical protein